MDKTMKVLSQAMGTAISEFVLQVPTGEFSFEQLLEAVGRMTKEQAESSKGEILVKPIKGRSPFELSFMRATCQLTKVKQLRSRSSQSPVFSAYDPPFPIIPLRVLDQS